MIKNDTVRNTPERAIDKAYLKLGMSVIINEGNCDFVL
jgi:hypothetical protein